MFTYRGKTRFNAQSHQYIHPTQTGNLNVTEDHTFNCTAYCCLLHHDLKDILNIPCNGLWYIVKEGSDKN